MEKKKTLLTGALIGLAAGVCNGLFGAGGGMIVVPALKKFQKMDPKRAHATSIAIIAALSIVSSFFYLQSGTVSFSDVLPYAIGGMVGGFLGGKLLKKIKSIWLSRIFGAFMIYAALRILLGG